VAVSHHSSAQPEGDAGRLTCWIAVSPLYGQYLFDDDRGRTRMTTYALAMVCAITLSACSGQAADTLPPLPTIEKATLAYANCVDERARKLAAGPGSEEILARQAVDSCRELRAKALALKGVPVMFPTVAEYDATHLGLARQTIKSSRPR